MIVPPALPWTFLSDASYALQVCGSALFRALQCGIGPPFRARARAVLNGFSQLAGIFTKNCLVLETLPKKVEQVFFCAPCRFRKTVKDSETVATIQHQPRILQILQVPRDVRLRGRKHILDVATTQFAMQQQIQDAQAVSIRQAFEIPFKFIHCDHFPTTLAPQAPVDQRIGGSNTSGLRTYFLICATAYIRLLVYTYANIHQTSHRTRRHEPRAASQ